MGPARLEFFQLTPHNWAENFVSYSSHAILRVKRFKAVKEKSTDLTLCFFSLHKMIPR